MMKKILALLMTLTMVVSTVACTSAAGNTSKTKSESETEVATEETIESTSTSVSEIPDNSITDEADLDEQAQEFLGEKASLDAKYYPELFSSIKSIVKDLYLSPNDLEENDMFLPEDLIYYKYFYTYIKNIQMYDISDIPDKMAEMSKTTAEYYQLDSTDSQIVPINIIAAALTIYCKQSDDLRLNMFLLKLTSYFDENPDEAAENCKHILTTYLFANEK